MTSLIVLFFVFGRMCRRRSVFVCLVSITSYLFTYLFTMHICRKSTSGRRFSGRSSSSRTTRTASSSSTESRTASSPPWTSRSVDVYFILRATCVCVCTTVHYLSIYCFRNIDALFELGWVLVKANNRRAGTRPSFLPPDEMFHASTGNQPVYPKQATAYHCAQQQPPLRWEGRSRSS